MDTYSCLPIYPSPSLTVAMCLTIRLDYGKPFMTSLNFSSELLYDLMVCSHMKVRNNQLQDRWFSYSIISGFIQLLIFKWNSGKLKKEIQSRSSFLFFRIFDDDDDDDNFFIFLFFFFGLLLVSATNSLPNPYKPQYKYSVISVNFLSGLLAVGCAPALSKYAL